MRLHRFRESFLLRPMFKIIHDVYSVKGVHAIIAAQETSILIIEKRCRSAMFDEGLIKEPLQQKKLAGSLGTGLLLLKPS